MGEALIMSAAKRWYVVHTYSGFENKGKDKEKKKVKREGVGEILGEILLPREKVVERGKGKKRTSKRNFFPGSILVQMEMNHRTWHLVKNTPKRKSTRLTSSHMS